MSISNQPLVINLWSSVPKNGNITSVGDFVGKCFKNETLPLKHEALLMNGQKGGFYIGYHATIWPFDNPQNDECKLYR